MIFSVHVVEKKKISSYFFLLMTAVFLLFVALVGLVILLFFSNDVVSQVSRKSFPAQLVHRVDDSKRSGIEIEIDDSLNSPRARKIILVHNGHQGSHAICANFMNLCLPVDCSEKYDYFSYRSTNKEEVNAKATRRWSEIAASPALVILLRVDVEELLRVADLERLYDIVVLQRSDLMFYVLSTYSKRLHLGDETGQLDDPQFQNSDYLASPISYDMQNVDQQAKKILLEWEQSLELVSRLAKHRPKVNSRVILYEHYLVGEQQYIEAIVKSLGGLELENRSCTEEEKSSLIIESEGTKVHKAHSQELVQSYAINALEVIRHFTLAGYPSFGNIIRHLGISEELVV